ncbi:MAG: outer membrane lipoprotein-sorting protein [Rhodothermia bacterium]|nr:MAG: outer membrane lipoprotein-sorting protein [Rhodothermia bacterium]
MKIKYSEFTVAFALITSASAWAQTPTGREVMEAYKEQDRTEDTASEMRMSIINARGGTRERKLTVWSITRDNDTEMQLIRFLAPADVKGTGFLSIENLDREDDNFLYLPALRKTRRIAGSDKQDRFVGTHFTYEDLESEELDAYTYALIGSETLDGSDTWIVEAVPTDPDKIKETAYSKRELWISKDHALILQAKYFDREGAYVKRLRARDVRQVPGANKWRAYHLTMEDVLKGSKTVIEILTYDIDQGVSEDYFTQRYLTRRG